MFDDVSNLKGKDIEEKIDVICGGFPCQDISLAGKGAGLAGKRSGLWSEFKRLIEEIKPKYAIIENVSALRSRGLDQVLREISEIGYDAEWHCITASSIGAPHRRDRIWIVAYPHINSDNQEKRGSYCTQDGVSEVSRSLHSSSWELSGTGDLLRGDTLCGHIKTNSAVSNTNSSGRRESNQEMERGSSKQSDSSSVQSSQDVSNANVTRLERWLSDGIASSQGWIVTGKQPSWF